MTPSQFLQKQIKALPLVCVGVELQGLKLAILDTKK